MLDWLSNSVLQNSGMIESGHKTDSVIQRAVPCGGSIILLLTILSGMIVLGGCKPPALRSDKVADESGKELSFDDSTAPAESFSEPAPAAPAPVAEEPVKTQYPLSRVITNAEGRSIPGEIVGKRGDEIAFRRTSDGQRFVVSLTQLSANDQLDLATLPDESAEAVAALLAEQTAASTAPRPPLGSGQRSRRAEWHDDPEKAFAEAKELGLPVYVLFTGSDWCPPCKILETTIHDDADFSDFADKNLVLLVLDFPKRKSQSAEIKERNSEMASSWGVGGYPTIYLAKEIDGAREPVSRTRDVESFLSGLESAIERL
jgi:thiol-disulfide isomerase/thioredoxin